MILTARRAVTAFTALAVPASLVLAGPAATASPGGVHPQPGLSVRQIVNGIKLHHHYTVSGGAVRAGPFSFAVRARWGHPRMLPS